MKVDVSAKIVYKEKREELRLNAEVLLGCWRIWLLVDLDPGKLDPGKLPTSSLVLKIYVLLMDLTVEAIFMDTDFERGMCCGDHLDWLHD